MILETGDLYHIYNQGNNRIRIFYSRENYFFFLNKIRKHIIPHADILAWCLMPNHFHLMAYVHSLEICKVINQDQSLITDDANTNNHKVNLNDSFGTVLSSYTRSINTQEKRTGSLFRIHTHSECLTKMDLHTPSFFNTQHGTLINQHFPEKNILRCALIISTTILSKRVWLNIPGIGNFLRTAIIAGRDMEN